MSDPKDVEPIPHEELVNLLGEEELEELVDEYGSEIKVEEELLAQTFSESIALEEETIYTGLNDEDSLEEF